MADMDVNIVDVDREMWSGKATFIFTRTTVGEIGILPRHIPLVAELVPDAMVRVEREGEDDAAHRNEWRIPVGDRRRSHCPRRVRGIRI